MKKITLLTVLLASFVGFAQSNKKTIQTYLETNRAQYGLTTEDIADWVIQSEVPGSGTGITSTHITQRYHGIEIFNAQSNAWVKNDNVLKIENNFQKNIGSKVNATATSMSVIQGIKTACTKLGIAPIPNYTIAETKSSNSFMLTDNVNEDLITAKLVYQVMSDKLKLAWYYQFYSPKGDHLWDVRVDALNGNILEKNDLMISCSFDTSHKTQKVSNSGFDFNKILFKDTFSAPMQVNAGSYRVIPYNYVSPNHSPFQLITSPENALASPNGWHDSNAAIGGTNAALKFTYSRGNNVLAQDDINGDNGSGVRADGGTLLNFDFPPGDESDLPATYLSSSITNLFYMNNIMHDVWYQYGFNEVSGNFQQSNLGRGGITSTTGDYVFADAQDGIANPETLPPFTATNAQNRNNANFSTPNDGARPRMQMYMWNDGAPLINYLNVNSPSIIAGPRAAKDNSFEGTDHVTVPVAPAAITSDLALYTSDPVNVGQNPNSACAVATNPFDVSGKITLIRRGGCFFSQKVKNAQDAGAIAVIIMDSIPQSSTYIGTIGMTSTGILGITIPAISITKDAGEILIAEMANGPVNVTIQDPGNSYLNADGSYDNGIVSHEYGHGISNKLIGGPANSSCMTNFEQMGEGWSDWFSLMMQIKSGDAGIDPKPIGTYVINQANDDGGLRSPPLDNGFPYSTDMAINQLTLIDSNNPDNTNSGYRYTIGKVWASVMWDLTWAYIDRYGFDPDIYNGTGGNNKVMQLALDALKLEACNTDSFINARDKIFAADLASTGGVNYDMIAEVFRRRGMGLNASSGDVNNSNDQVEDFTGFPLATTQFNYEGSVRIYPNPSNGLLSIRVNQYVGKINIQLIDINGRTILNQTDDKFNNEKSINISALQNGVYIMKVTGDNLNYSEKIIKN
jgi:hypothetical protein